MVTLLVFQIGLLAYHQATTLFDFYPFNGAGQYTWKERLAEAGLNGVLMSLPPIGFGFHIHGLMVFGVIYYFVLFLVELIIWWGLYLTTPTGRWRVLYNYMLSAVTFNNPKADVIAHWCEMYDRLFRGTITILPVRGNRPTPNLEHTILHVLTLATAIVTAGTYFHLW